MNSIDSCAQDSNQDLKALPFLRGNLSSFAKQLWIPGLKEKMRSWPLYQRVFRQYLEESILAWNVFSLSRADIDLLIEKIKARSLSLSTENRILSVLKHFLKSAFEHAVISQDFSAIVNSQCSREKPRHDLYLSSEAIKSLFAKLENSHSQQAKAIQLLLLTGATKSEILLARWENYDPASQTLTVKSRGGKKRKLRLGPQSVNILKSLSSSESSAWIFPGRNPEQHMNDVFRFWAEIRKECGLEGIRIQDLKHNYINWQNRTYGYSIGIEEQLGRADNSFIPQDNLEAQKCVILAMTSKKISQPQLESAKKNPVESKKSCKRIKLEASANHNDNCYETLALKTLRKISISPSILKKKKSALYIGMDGDKCAIPGPTALDSFQNTKEIARKLGISSEWLELVSSGDSFLSAFKIACLKIMTGELDVALVGGKINSTLFNLFNRNLDISMQNLPTMVLIIISKKDFASEFGYKILNEIKL